MLISMQRSTHGMLLVHQSRTDCCGVIIHQVDVNMLAQPVDLAVMLVTDRPRIETTA